MDIILTENPISFNDFISSNIEKVSGSSRPRWDADTIFSQMIDVWGEVDKAVEYIKNKQPIEKVEQQINIVHRICSSIHLNKEVKQSIKDELKDAQWELYDFCIWNNQWKNDINSIMEWWNPWCPYVDYSLV
jgi:mevalonate kinase